MIASISSFKKEVNKELINRLRSNLNPVFYGNEPEKLEFLSQRYLNNILISTKNIPKKQILLHYLNESENNFRPDLAANSCEIFGGILHELMKEDKFFTISDFEFKLAIAYNELSKKNSIYDNMSRNTPTILKTFRETTDSIKNMKLLPEYDVKENIIYII